MAGGGERVEEKEKPTERRRAAREDSFLATHVHPVREDPEVTPFRGDLVNVSLTGAYVETYAAIPDPGSPDAPVPNPWVPGGRVRVTFELDPPLTRQARITRIERVGQGPRTAFALEFEPELGTKELAALLAGTAAL